MFTGPHIRADLKLHAKCVRCGNIAHYSYRKTPGEAQVMIDHYDIYGQSTGIAIT